VGVGAEREARDGNRVNLQRYQAQESSSSTAGPRDLFSGKLRLVSVQARPGLGGAGAGAPPQHQGQAPSALSVLRSAQGTRGSPRARAPGASQRPTAGADSQGSLPGSPRMEASKEPSMRSSPCARSLTAAGGGSVSVSVRRGGGRSGGGGAGVGGPGAQSQPFGGMRSVRSRGDAVLQAPWGEPSRGAPPGSGASWQRQHGLRGPCA